MHSLRGAGSTNIRLDEQVQIRASITRMMKLLLALDKGPICVPSPLFSMALHKRQTPGESTIVLSHVIAEDLSLWQQYFLR